MPWPIAIVAEVIATSTLKSTEGFTRLWPSVVVVVAYETAFILLSLCLKKIPVGIVYAVWSGVGVALCSAMVRNHSFCDRVARARGDPHPDLRRSRVADSPHSGP